MWLNTPLDALAGLSPREALRTEEGQFKVIQLLQQLTQR